MIVMVTEEVGVGSIIHPLVISVHTVREEVLSSFRTCMREAHIPSSTRYHLQILSSSA